MRLPAPSILLLFVAAILGPLAILGAAGTLTHQYMHDDAQRRVLHSAELLREQALRVFDLYQLILGQVERRAGTRSWTELIASRELYEELRALTDPVREASSVFYLAPTGQHWASSNRFPTPQVDASDRDYFVAHRERPSALFIGAPSRARRSGQEFFAVTRARLGTAGTFDGLFGVSGDIAYFREFYRGLRGSELDVLALIRADGEFLVREPPSGHDQNRLSENSGLMKAVSLAPRGLVRVMAEIDGVDRLYAFSKVGDYPIYVSYGISMRSVDAQWRQVLTIYAIVTMLAIAMLLVAAELARRNANRALRAGAAREEQLRLRLLAEDSLRRGQRLEAIGRMTGGITHDINNLLQVMQVNIEVLRRRLGGSNEDERHLRPLAAMERATNQGTRLTRQLLSFSRRTSLQPKRIDLASFLPELSELLRAALRNRIDLVLEVAPDTAPIEADPDELELALLNLSTNARDAMMLSGGRLVLRARNLPAGTVVDGERLASVRVALTVTDTGSGMAAETLQSIFDPFFTTKPVGQGTGLGLSQVYGFITQSGGRVSVQSDLDKGTTFTLLFPPAGAESPGEDRPANGSSRAALAGLRILLVDDEVDTGLAIASMLVETGAMVRTLDSPQQALETLDSEPFDILLSDMRMPGTTGDVLAVEAQSRHPRLTIVLMTAYPEALHADSGRFEVLQKPLNPRVLVSALRRALAQQR